MPLNRQNFTEEHVNGTVTNHYGDAFICGNNAPMAFSCAFASRHLHAQCSTYQLLKPWELSHFAHAVKLEFYAKLITSSLETWPSRASTSLFRCIILPTPGEVCSWHPAKLGKNALYVIFGTSKKMITESTPFWQKIII